jgi:hypothetical protein
MAKKTASITEEFDPQTYAYPRCRMQHQWKFYDGSIDSKTKLAHQVDKCTRCDTRRHFTISMRSLTYGQLFKGTTYSYPGDYQVPHGLDKSDKGKLRMRNFFTELEDAN